MKKEYNTPVMVEMEINMTSMLCLSGGLGSDANEPAHSPDLDYLDTDIEDW